MPVFLRPSMLTCWLGVAVCCVSMAMPASGQDDTWRRNYPAYYEVMSPHLEDSPGPNTYWHDPNLPWRDDAACYDHAPEEAGCTPLWMAEAEGLFLFRDTKSSRPMATLVPGGPTVLGTNDFDAEFDAGLRATIGRTLGTWYRLEATYFGTYEWADSVTVRNLDANAQAGTGNLYSPFSNFGNPAGVDGLDFNNFASLAFTSRLSSVELNLRRRMLARPGSWESSFLVGVRYVDLSETFGYQTAATTPGPATASVDYTTRTDNRLIGAQLGLTTQFLVRPRLWIDFDIKGGIFANEASLSYRLDQVSTTGAASSFAGSNQRNRTAFLGELSLDMHYQFAGSWTFLAGYNAYWLTGVALAEDNFNTDINLLQLGPAQVSHRGESVYHGPHIGLTWTY